VICHETGEFGLLLLARLLQRNPVHKVRRIQPSHVNWPPYNTSRAAKRADRLTCQREPSTVKLLVAEDQSATRIRLKSYLEKSGHEVTLAEDGLAAWQMFQEGNFSIVVTDWEMPGLDGLELTKRIRVDSREQYTYVIVLTARSATAEIIQGMEAGADDFLTKPFAQEELRVRIRAGERIIELQRTLALRNADLHAANQELDKARQKIRETFGRYVTETVATEILDSEDGMELGGERRKITILTSDLRGFTAMSEALPPEEVIRALNIYFRHMSEVITAHGGTIDEFMGDGILVFFGAPVAAGDDAERAVACAVAMQAAMVVANRELEQHRLPQCEMGIGINTGEAVVGNIGSEVRTKYGAMGSQVNLAFRIESLTAGNQILISESTYAEAKSRAKIKGQQEATVKGVKDPITVYEVVGFEGDIGLLPA